MNHNAIKIAKQEALRFLKRVKAVEDAGFYHYEESDDGCFDRIEGPDPKGGWRFSHSAAGPRETGALRRASLDLTRALAEMRRS